jgi:hypothetical protein
MIECYTFLCPCHSLHDGGPDEGPFCYQERCTQTARYIQYVDKYIKAATRNTRTLASVPLVPVVFKPKR